MKQRGKRSVKKAKKPAPVRRRSVSRAAPVQKHTNRSVPLGQLASVIRSKLSGPFRVTFDVIFTDRATYETVVAANIFTKKNIARLYEVPISRISSLYAVPMANAIKFTMTRELDPMFSTSDSHGAQQHAPLIDIQVPIGGGR